MSARSSVRIRKARSNGTSVLGPAVVLSCAGAPEGDLNLVRNLGRRGVPVWVITEYAEAPSITSRFCVGHRLVEGYTREPGRLLAVLRELRAELGVAPVIFASADPDLAGLITLHDALGDVMLSTVIDPDLSSVLSNKEAFDSLAQIHNLPVPRTWRLGRTVDTTLESIVDTAKFPLILKPAQLAAWQRAGLHTSLQDCKAWRADDEASLLPIAKSLQKIGAETLIQEFVPGPDENHVDVHAYVDRAGRVIATYSGRKWRIAPPHAGSGCFVETIADAELEAMGAEILTRIGYRGLANMNFKRHEQTGKWVLFEINPRVSQWHILPTRSGVDLPWLAYCDARGRDEMRVDNYRRVGLHYLNEARDWYALRGYRREGLWTFWRWLGQIFLLLLRGRLIFQLADPRDPRPALVVLCRALQAKGKRLIVRLTPG